MEENVQTETETNLSFRPVKVCLDFIDDRVVD